MHSTNGYPLRQEDDRKGTRLEPYCIEMVLIDPGQRSRNLFTAKGLLVLNRGRSMSKENARNIAGIGFVAALIRLTQRGRYCHLH